MTKSSNSRIESMRTFPRLKLNGYCLSAALVVGLLGVVNSTAASAGVLSGVSSISAGNHFTCVVKAGTVKCWGSNQNGRLGFGHAGSEIASVPYAVDAIGLGSGVVQVATSFDGEHACALGASVPSKCWGRNGVAALGLPAKADGSDYTAPESIGVIPGTAISAGGNANCVLLTTQEVECWGVNIGGQLGNGTTGASTAPYARVGVTGIGGTNPAVGVAAGGGFACAIVGTVSKNVMCWGAFPDASRLGRRAGSNPIVPHHTPDVVRDVNNNPIGGITAISASAGHACAITANGGVKCWGSAINGALGDDTTGEATGTYAGERNYAVDVVGLTNAKAISAGVNHTCAIAGADNQVKCWGLDSSGQLGDSLTGSDAANKELTPVDVITASSLPLTGVTAISAGREHTCAVVGTTGEVMCWGRNNQGQLGDGSISADNRHYAGLVYQSQAPEDFNADGRSDILWHNSATGVLFELQMNGLATGASGVIDQETDLNWKVVAVADLNNDGRADVVWQHSTTGQVKGLLMNGTTVSGEGTIYTEPNTNWKIVGAGDFNGDGNADLLWKNNATGDVFLMLMNGLAVTSSGVIYSEPNTNWQIQKVADFNGDGRADVLWRNVATGDVFVLLMNGTTVIGGGVIYSEPNTAWEIQSAADFNGDGRADVLWRNTATGDVFMMLMNGTTIIGGSVFYGEPNADWKIVATGDYNGDVRADILWRNTTTGQVYMMLMNGTTITQAGFVYTEPDQNWKILGQ